MEYWKEIFKDMIQEDYYEVKLINGEEYGLIIKFQGKYNAFSVKFGEVKAVRMIDEGIVQTDIYSENEVQKYKKEKFKNMIDRDSCFRKTLAELSRETQCSAGHIRKLFVKQYLIEPGEYRARLRLRRIMHYIEQTDLSLKEIADQVGMKHVTHLHLFLRERCGTTPRMLLKQYRGE